MSTVHLSVDKEVNTNELYMTVIRGSQIKEPQFLIYVHAY